MVFRPKNHVSEGGSDQGSDRGRGRGRGGVGSGSWGGSKSVQNGPKSDPRRGRGGWSGSSFPRGKNFTFENTKIFELLDIFTFEMRKISLFGFLGGSKVFESRKLGEKPILEVKIVKSEV